MALYQQLFLHFATFALLAQCELESMEQQQREQPKGFPQQIQALHNKMDIDGNSKLSLDEVLEFSRLTRAEQAAKEAALKMQDIDKDKDGKVTFEEIVAFDENSLSEELAKAMFAAADKTKDGSLNQVELALWLDYSADANVLKAVVASNIQENDMDKDGKLDLQEFHKWINGNAVTQEESKTEFAVLDVDGDGKLSEEELHRYESAEFHVRNTFEALFTNADTDKDSHLSLDEFQKHMHEMPEQITVWIDHHEL